MFCNVQLSSDQWKVDKYDVHVDSLNKCFGPTPVSWLTAVAQINSWWDT